MSARYASSSRGRGKREQAECAQRQHRRFGRGRLRIPPTVGDAMDVDIDSDRRLAAGNAQHQIGALRPDAG